MQKTSISISLFMLLSFAGCGSNVDTDLDTTQADHILEDAEEGISPNWHTIKGDKYPSQRSANNGSNYCVHLPVTWYKEGDYWHNPYEYHLDIDHATEEILELDVGGTGEEIPHYVIGVEIQTSYGTRTILWNSWYNHENLQARYNRENATMVFPSPVELVRGFGYEDVGVWSHFRGDIVSSLHHFEPDNRFLYVNAFVATGGDLDNIGLSQR